MYLYSHATQGFYKADIHGDGVPSDAVQVTEEEHATLLAGQSAGQVIKSGADGRPVLEEPPPPTAEQLQAAFVAVIQFRLDAFARTRNYDGILSACTYATSAVAKFQAEGQRAVELRDQTWGAAYEILAEVQAGTRPMPASLADIEADLPALEWPQ